MARLQEDRRLTRFSRPADCHGLSPQLEDAAASRVGSQDNPKPQTKSRNNITMATSITPLGRRVLVKRSSSEEKTAGGIFLPDTAKEKPQEAEVIALGTGKDDEGKNVADLFTVKKGDKVLISKYGGTEVKVDGEDLLIINETDILGIIG
jgi:chaperonin GroES